MSQEYALAPVPGVRSFAVRVSAAAPLFDQALKNKKEKYCFQISSDKFVTVRYKRDTRKKRFIDALTCRGTVYHAAQAAGISRNTVYRWRQEDFEFAEAWYEAHENAVSASLSSTFETAIRIDFSSLREWNGWNAAAREYVKICGDEYKVEDIARSYYEAVSEFHEWFFQSQKKLHKKEFAEANALRQRLTSSKWHSKWP